MPKGRVSQEWGKSRWWRSWLKEYSITQSSFPPRFILKSGTIVKDLLNCIPHNSFWNGNHLILDRSNGWLLNGYVELEDFEELVEICYSHGAVELPIELKVMLKELMKNHTALSMRKMQQKLGLDDPYFYQKNGSYQLLIIGKQI